MASDWFYEVAGVICGPLTSRQLRALADDGRLAPEDHVRQGSDGPWGFASQIKGLFLEMESGKGARSEKMTSDTVTSDTVTSDTAGSDTAAPDLKVDALPSIQVSKPRKPRVKIPTFELESADAQTEAPEEGKDTPPTICVDRAARASTKKPPASEAPLAKGPKPPKTLPPRALPKKNLPKKTLPPRVLPKKSLPKTTDTKRQQEKRKIIWLVGIIAVLGVVGMVLLLIPGRSGESPKPRAALKPAVEGPSEDFAEASLGPIGQSSAGSMARSSWTDASRSSAKVGDIEVTIRSATIGSPRLIRPSGRATRPTRQYMRLGVEIRYRDTSREEDRSDASTNRAVRYRGWATGTPGHDPLVLTDGRGTQYRQKSFRSLQIEGQIDKASLVAGDVIEDVLLFEGPSDKGEASRWRLELPAAAFEGATFSEQAFEGPGLFRFEIPAKMIAVEEKLKPKRSLTAENDLPQEPTATEASRPLDMGTDEDEEPDIFKDYPEFRDDHD